jgi:hypothetical protein
VTRSLETVKKDGRPAARSLRFRTSR